MQRKRIKIEYIPDVINRNEAKALYKYLKFNIDWQDGVYSRTGQTRLSAGVNPLKHKRLLAVIVQTLAEFPEYDFTLHQVYLNYYRDGNDSTPSHKHPNTCQIIISLGACRTLKIATKEYEMTNGSVAIFGPSLHSVPKQPKCKRGRISIALFTTIRKT